MNTTKALFFDLDGTLTDSCEGISRCFIYALEKMNVTPPSLDYIATHYIGPSLLESLSNHVGKDRAHEALDHYSERYVNQRRGILENRVYDGIPEALEKPSRHKKLFVMTAKSQGISAQIVEHFDLMRFFGAVFGPLPNELHQTKAELLAKVCREHNIAPEDAVMIGDRKFDMLAASENGMKSVGVTWGYGSEAELQAHNATQIIHKPQDLTALFLDE